MVCCSLAEIQFQSQKPVRKSRGFNLLKAWSPSAPSGTDNHDQSEDTQPQLQEIQFFFPSSVRVHYNSDFLPTKPEQPDVLQTWADYYPSPGRWSAIDLLTCTRPPSIPACFVVQFHFRIKHMVPERSCWLFPQKIVFKKRRQRKFIDILQIHRIKWVRIIQSPLHQCRCLHRSINPFGFYIPASTCDNGARQNMTTLTAHPCAIALYPKQLADPSPGHSQSLHMQRCRSNTDCFDKKFLHGVNLE